MTRLLAILICILFSTPALAQERCLQSEDCYPQTARLMVVGGGVPVAAGGPWFSDTFTEIGGSDVALEDHTPDTGTSWSGGNTTNFDVAYDTDELKLDTADSKYAIINDTPPSANYYVQANGKTGGARGRVGVVARYVDEDNLYYGFFDNDGAIKLYKKITGSWIAIDADCAGTETIASFSSSTYYTVKMIVNGDDVELYINTVLRCSGTAGDLDTANKAGLNLATTASRITTCEAGGL